MNEEQKPEAHRLAEKLHDAINLIECGFSDDIATNDLSLAAMELESLHTRVQELEAKEAKPTTGELVMDVRCEGCGYMTHHREHMGCVRAAKQHTHPTPSAPAQPQADALDAERWRFIKRKLCLTGNGDGTCAMQALNLPARILGWPDVGELAIAQFLDAAIDAAIAVHKEKTE